MCEGQAGELVVGHCDHGQGGRAGHLSSSFHRKTGIGVRVIRIKRTLEMYTVPDDIVLHLGDRHHFIG